MKKYILLRLGLLISITFFTGCSDDNNEINTNSVSAPVLLSKITTIYYDNPTHPETTISILEYNKQKQLTKVTSDERTSICEYDPSGKPVKTSYYTKNGTLEYYAKCIYTGEQLTTLKSIYTNPDYNTTVTYTYHNGKMSSQTLCQSPNCTNPSKSSYIYNGDNILEETNITGGLFSQKNKIEYSYDNKLNPFSYTDKYFKILMGGAYAISKNNYITGKISYEDSNGN